MLKGVNQGCFPKSTPLDELFATSAAAGFDSVELNLSQDDHNGLTLQTTAQEAQKIKALADEHNLQLPTVSTELHWENSFAAPDPAVRQTAQNILRKQIELAAELGADTVLVIPGTVTPEIAYDDCYKRSHEAIQAVVPFAEQHQICIGIENVWNRFLLSPLEMNEYVDTFNSQFVGIYFNVGNILVYGIPEDWIRILNERIRKIRVKDFKIATGNATGFTNLFSGDVNWPAVSEALHEIGYQGPITADLSFNQHSPQQTIEDAARHIAKIIGT